MSQPCSHGHERGRESPRLYAQARHHWFDASRTHSAEEATLLRFAGWLMGQAVCNRSPLGVELPSLLFAKLLTRRLEPSLAALEEFDPQAASSLRSVLQMSETDFGALAAMEDAEGLSRQAYVDRALARLLGEDFAWQAPRAMRPPPPAPKR